MTKREQSGLILAATARIIKRNGTWYVPSQKTPTKRYEVDEEKSTCTCPDHKEWRHKCKHIFAVEIVSRRSGGRNEFPEEDFSDLDLDQKKGSKPRDWAAYNEAQTTEKTRFQVLLNDLCKPLVNPRYKLGRPRVPRSDAVFAVVFRTYCATSLRRFMPDFRAAQEKGYIRETMHWNAIASYLHWPPMTQILLDLIEQSSLPLRAVESDFAVDSTGFSTSRFVRWYDEKYGAERTGHDWVKVHVMSGVKSQIISAVEIRRRSANDSPLFGPLLKQTAKNFDVKEVSADKAYSTVKNLMMTVAAGAQPFIQFKDNATTDRGGVWAKMLLYYQLRREEFMEHYHKRSTVESAFASIKAKFRDHVRSRSDVAMKNEALTKILCHNICCVIRSQEELGIEPVFWGDESAAAPAVQPEDDKAA